MTKTEDEDAGGLVRVGDILPRVLDDLQRKLGPIDPAGALVLAEAIDDLVSEDLSAQVHAKTTAMLQTLLPDDAPENVVASVLAGMAAGLIQELWDRNPNPPAVKMAALKAAWAELGDSYLSQFAELEA